MIEEKKQIVSWYKEPYMWLVVSFPLIAVIGGIFTIYLAIESDDGLVVDDYYKRGLEVNKVLDRDHAASDYQLKANLEISRSNPVFSIVLEGNTKFKLPDEIKVSFLHPTRKGLDHHLVLKKDNTNSYRGSTPPLVQGKWYIQIETNEWRLFREYSVQ